LSGELQVGHPKQDYFKSCQAHQDGLEFVKIYFMGKVPLDNWEPGMGYAIYEAIRKKTLCP
jgi:hypothetical protein